MKAKDLNKRLRELRWENVAFEEQLKCLKSIFVDHKKATLQSVISDVKAYFKASREGSSLN